MHPALLQQRLGSSSGCGSSASSSHASWAPCGGRACQPRIIGVAASSSSIASSSSSSSSSAGTATFSRHCQPRLQPCLAGRRSSVAVQASQKPELTTNKPAPRYESLVAWVAAAMAFGGGIWYVEGPTKAEEYFAGYLLEQSLSVDNLFVFLLAFSFFKTPEAAQGKVLQYGIITAAVLRLAFVLGGVTVINNFRPALALFAAILIFSSFKLLTGGEKGDEEEELADNAVVKLCRKVIKTSDSYDGDNFFTTLADGTRVATPLLLTLAVVELSDVVFAIDSIPAVFGVTLDPFIIYTSNMFAILSLRSLYGFVSTIMTELRFLDKAVALVLGFIGAKMLLGFADLEVPTDVSLLVVGLVLGGGVAASLLLPEPEAES